MTRIRTRLLVALTLAAVATGGFTAAAGAITRKQSLSAIRARGLTKTELKRARRAVLLLHGAFNAHQPRRAAERYISPTTYIQHNPLVANGRDAFIAFAEPFVAQFPQLSLEIKRVVAQGDLVVVHGLSKVNPQDRGTVEADVFRFDRANEVVEHWDVLQPVSETTANGNPQV